MIRKIKRALSKSKAVRLIFISTLIANLSYADIKLPQLFSSNMVLQQQSEVNIWGKADRRAKVSLTTSWNKVKYNAQAGDDGAWRIKLRTPGAGGPYTITISDGKQMKLENVMIGEVWICSGQSNMEMKLRGNSSPILNADQIILNADNPLMRLYTVGRATSLTPLDDTDGKWQVATSETAREFSALAFQFGQILQKKLQVPVGLIVSSVGGTKIQTWMNAKSLAPYSEVKIPSTLAGLESPHKEPTALFNGMISPLVAYTAKGFLWYQGESNRDEPALYAKLFPVMVKDWRNLWGQGDLPFYYVQIAPLALNDEDRSGTKMREVQLNAMNVVPNSGMASAIDVGMENDIHPMDKTVLAERLSFWALAKTYGIKGIAYKGPAFQSLQINGDKAVVKFDSPHLTSYKKPLTTFEIAGSDRVFYPAEAEIKGGEITVKSSKVAKPVAVRYAFKEWVVGELYDNNGLPVSSFRTDEW
jgi:sialate O-acetylesterase